MLEFALYQRNSASSSPACWTLGWVPACAGMTTVGVESCTPRSRMEPTAGFASIAQSRSRWLADICDGPTTMLNFTFKRIEGNTRRHPHGPADRIGNSGESPAQGRDQRSLLHHGRADAAGRGVLHQGGHPAHRRAPRAGRRPDGAGLQPPAAEAGGVHGRVRSRRHQPDHRHGQCADRLLPRRRHRRLGAHRPVRPASVPGDRSGQDHGRLRQVGRPRLQPQAHPRAGQRRLPACHERQARPDLSRFPRRHPLRQDGGERGRLVDVRAARSWSRVPSATPSAWRSWSRRWPRPRSP